MQDLTPIAIAALLLIHFTIAQHIGLRPIKSISEAIGIGATIICTLPIVFTLDSLLHYAVLEPAHISYLRQFISIALTAAITPLMEAVLRSRYPQWFPRAGTFLPLAVTTCCLLIAVQIYRAPEATLLQSLLNGFCFSVGATFLLATFHTMRERINNCIPTTSASSTLKGMTINVLNGIFIIVALCGVLSVLQ